MPDDGGDARIIFAGGITPQWMHETVLKALEKVCLEDPTEVVDGELVARGRHEVPLRLVVARNEEEIGNGKLD